MGIEKISTLVNRAHQAFIQYDGVLGVGYGTRQIKGEKGEVPAIMVFVEKKLPKDKVKKNQLIPKRYLEHYTKVYEVHFDRKDLENDTTGLYEGIPMAEFLDWGKIHQLNLAQKEMPRLTTAPRKARSKKDDIQADDPPTVETRGNLFIIEDHGTLTYTTSSGETLIDLVGAWSLFRDTFGDDYDFVSFFLDNTDPSFPYMGNYSSTIYRSASDSGYGAGSANNRATWENSSRLLRMVCHSWYSLRTMLHEVGHQWLFYVNYKNSAAGTEQTTMHESWDASWSTGQKPYHPGRWLDNDCSCMDYDHDDWTEVSSGVYSSDGVADADFNFCPLDQYLMGFLHPEAVSSSRSDPLSYPASGGTFQIINNPTLRTDGDYDSTPIELTVDNIVWNEGARTPDHLNSQRVFHQAIIAITYDKTTYAAFLNNAETNRANQAENWRKATEGRSVIDTSLLRSNIDDIYMRDNTSDTGGTFPGGSFWNSPDLFIRLSDDDPSLFLDPTVANSSIHQNPVSNQDCWVYARVLNKGTSAYQNATVNFYIANYNGFSGRDTVAEAVPRTEVIYPIDWHPDSLIGTTTLTSVPAGGTAVAKVLWPQAQLPPEDWHPCLLVEIIPLDPDPNALHNVWDNKKLAQKNLHIEYVPSGDYEFILPFVIGHALNPSIFTTVGFERNIIVPGMEIYLHAGQAIEEIHQLAGGLYNRIPGLEKTESILSELYTEIDKTETPPKQDGILVTIPKDTTLGFGTEKNIHTVNNMVEVTFCTDTKVLVSNPDVKLQHLGLAPAKGFELLQLKGDNVLKMTETKKAFLPVSLNKMKQHEMKLRIRLNGKKLKEPVTLHITQRDKNNTVVGGIDVQLQPKR